MDGPRHIWWKFVSSRPERIAQAKAEEARSRADEAVRNARDEADRTIAGLSTRRDALVDQLASMQERLIGVARDLESAMDVRVSLPAIPSVDALFDGSEGTEAASSADAAPSNGGSAWAAADAATDEDQKDAGADGPERPIVIGEAEATYEHAPEDEALMDPSYEELWDGTDAIKIDLPDIPALDLDWGDDDDRS